MDEDEPKIISYDQWTPEQGLAFDILFALRQNTPAAIRKVFNDHRAAEYAVGRIIERLKFCRYHIEWTKGAVHPGQPKERVIVINNPHPEE